MSGGHGHDAHATGGHGSHGHAAAAAHDAAHGSAEIPPAPAVREISPARDDYSQPWPGSILLWPAVWVGVAALLFLAARAWTGPVKTHSAHGEHGATHSAPASPAGLEAAHGEGR